MELFFRTSTVAGWEHSAGVLCGLRAAAESSREVVLQSDSPLKEVEDLVAAAWFFRLAGGSLANLCVVSPCPSPAWIAPLRAAGVERVFMFPRGLANAFTLADALEVPADLCPALHIRTSRGGGVSVCGHQSDCMILARHHYTNHCFGNWRSCQMFLHAQASQGSQP
jgi:hypothetical protein